MSLSPEESTTPFLSQSSEDSELFLHLKCFFNQYVAVSSLQLLLVLSIVTIDLSSLSGLIKIQPGVGQEWFEFLDFTTLVLFTLEVLVNLGTFGVKRYLMASATHRMDLIIVILSDLTYFFTYSWDGSADSKKVEIGADAVRSVLRMIRLAIVIVRLNDVLSGPVDEISARFGIRSAKNAR